MHFNGLKLKCNCNTNGTLATVAGLISSSSLSSSERTVITIDQN